jgi:hypothetical protein
LKKGIFQKKEQLILYTRFCQYSITCTLEILSTGIQLAKFLGISNQKTSCWSLKTKNLQLKYLTLDLPNSMIQSKELRIL